GEHLAYDFTVSELQRAAFGTRRGVGAELVDREIPLVEQAQHLRADQAGRPDHADAHPGHAVSSSNAACNACTARSTSRSCTTQEMRMVDVEIISMLTFSAASVSNIWAATPGFVRIPAPTNDTRPISASKLAPPASISTTILSTISIVRANSSLGIVNEISVWPAVDTFCSIMSTLRFASASARNPFPAIPGRPGPWKI